MTIKIYTSKKGREENKEGGDKKQLKKIIIENVINISYEDNEVVILYLAFERKTYAIFEKGEYKKMIIKGGNNE